MSDAPPAAEETRPLDEMDFLPFDSGADEEARLLVATAVPPTEFS